jgi:antitoxin component YwqK of YwqJK toxin-antitoxin module
MKKITLRLYLKNGKTMKYYTNDKIKRIYSLVSLAKFPDKVLKAYVKVSYGKFLDAFGKMTEFYNDGYYTDKKELREVISIFWNEK